LADAASVSCGAALPPPLRMSRPEPAWVSFGAKHFGMEGFQLEKTHVIVFCLKQTSFGLKHEDGSFKQNRWDY